MVRHVDDRDRALIRATIMSTTNKPDPNPRRSRRIIDRITRRWRLILLLWLIGTIPIVFLIHRLVVPTFEAVSILRVTPTQWSLYEPTRQVDFRAAEAYLQTQIGLISSDRVLGPAIGRPGVVNLSTITATDDPRTFLRQNMKVEIVKDAFLIRVSLELPDRNQAAAIVNAVVHSYLEYNGEHQRSGNSNLRNSLAEQLKKYRNAIEEKRAELKKVVEKELTDVRPKFLKNLSGKEDDPARSPLASVTESQFQKVVDELINTDLDLIKAQSILEATEAGAAGNDARPTNSERPSAERGGACSSKGKSRQDTWRDWWWSRESRIKAHSRSTSSIASSTSC